VVKASPAKPKDLNQLFLKEKGPQAAAGDAKKTKKADQAPGLQLSELSVQAGGEQQRVDSEFDTMSIPMCHEMLKAMGYTHTTRSTSSSPPSRTRPRRRRWSC
jgi:hypothetical protein